MQTDAKLWYLTLHNYDGVEYVVGAPDTKTGSMKMGTARTLAACTTNNMLSVQVLLYK